MGTSENNTNTSFVNATEANSTQSNATSSNATGMIINTNATEANSTQSNATSSNATNATQASLVQNTSSVPSTSSASNSSGGAGNSSASPLGNGNISTTTLAAQASQSTTPYVKCSMTTPPPIQKDCECNPTVIDLTETPKGMVSPGYENIFVSVIVLSCLGSFSIGTCVTFFILQGYDSPRVHPSKTNGLARGRSIPTARGDRLIFEGGNQDSISAIEKAAADDLEAIKQNTAAKKKESADRVAQRLLSRQNKMAMKLAKSEALKTVECFKSLKMKHMAMVIGKMRLVTYDEGSILCEQGDNANEFFVCMEGTLRVEVNEQFIRTMGECDYLGEKALLGKGAIRGATVSASSKAEVFVLSRHQFELLENEGLPIKQIVASVKHKVEQYEKDDQALENVKANEARAQKIVKRATHVSRQSSSMSWLKQQQTSQNEGDSDSEELLIEEDDDGVVTL